MKGDFFWAFGVSAALKILKNSKQLTAWPHLEVGLSQQWRGWSMLEQGIDERKRAGGPGRADQEQGFTPRHLAAAGYKIIAGEDHGEHRSGGRRWS